MNKKLWFESNYKNYYTLYKNYASNNFAPTNKNDETNLNNLAAMCPGTDGACVYQARALYNTVFNALPFYPVCGNSSARMMNNQDIENSSNIWNLKLYPNPTSDKLTVESGNENESLEITISDLSGRLFLATDLKLNGFSADIDLTLINGVYLITIVNSQNEKLIRKLIISK